MIIKQYIMKNKIAFLLSSIVLFSCNSADKNSPSATAPTAATTSSVENADSLRYMNIAQSGTNYTYSPTPNTIVLANGMKLEFTSIERLPIPDKLKVPVMLANDKDKQADYDLADLVIKATNTSGDELKFSGSNMMCAEFTLYSNENNYRSYYQQSTLSAGNVYINSDPVPTEKFTAESKSYIALFDDPYKPGETKTGTGVVIPVPKTVTKFGYVSLKTRTKGEYHTYACSIAL
jgi:hypothetical protein